MRIFSKGVTLFTVQIRIRRVDSVSVVRFTWDTGYVDYYIDDVRFYRLANTSSTTPPP